MPPVSLLLLLLGLAFIVWGTKIVVDNAILVARHHRLSDFFFGVVVLAIGSDLPELVVSLDAALLQHAGQQTANLIVGNALGSCFGQLGLVVGVGGLLGRLSLSRQQLLWHGGMLLLAIVLLILAGVDGVVGRVEGALLVAAFIGYITLVLLQERQAGGRVVRQLPAGSGSTSIVASWLRLALGIGIVVLCAEVIVRAAMALAIHWGVDQSFIGIAIIGVGTSLPEVVISIAAIVRRRIGFSMGNLLGSNVLDTLLPIGVAALVVPVEFSRAMLGFDIPMLMGLTILVLGFLSLRHGVRWPQAAVVLAAYASYLLTITRSL